MDTQFKYFAFISYSSKDTAWGKRLQKKLEHYRMPATLCSEHGWKRKPISPVFFAPTDIQPGGLDAELQERLRASRHLIVICSPNSAKSEWVGKEIEFFHSLGRTQDIHFFIVDGKPHSGDPDTECFNPVVNKLGLPEILGANIHEKVYRWPWLNRERAYVQLISKLLGVEFDAIWQRHKRTMVRNATAWTLGGIAVVAAIVAVGHANQPIEVDLRLNEASVHNDALPPLKDAVVTVFLDNETKTDTLAALGDHLSFTNIPHRFLGKPVRMTVSCNDFRSLDTTLALTQAVTLDVFRDPAVYGDIHIGTWNQDTEQTSPNTTFVIDGHETVTDANGRITLFIPLEMQKPVYRVEASIPLKDEDTRIVMPCGENDVILTQ